MKYIGQVGGNMNEKIEKGFNIDKIGTEYMLNTFLKGYSHIMSEYEQRHRGDATNGKQCIDFKFDQWNNDNIVIEVMQKSNTNWLDELDDETIIMWVKLATGIIAKAKVKDLKQFRDSILYSSRRSFTAYTGTTFKNFRLIECMHYVNGFSYTDVSKKEIWLNRPTILKQYRENKLNLYS